MAVDKRTMLWDLVHSLAEEDPEVCTDALLDSKRSILKRLDTIIETKNVDEFIALLISYDVVRLSLPYDGIRGLTLKDKAYAIADYILVFDP